MATLTRPATPIARAVPHPPVTSVMALVGLVAAVGVPAAGLAGPEPAVPGRGR